MSKGGTTITDSMSATDAVHQQMIEALKVDDVQLCEKLVRGGAAVNGVINREFDARTALHHAAETKALACARFLLASGWDLEARDAAGNTPLIVAARFRDPAMVDLLLGLGARAGAQDKTGSTALHLAAEDENIGNILSLVNAGAVVDARTKSSQETSLHVACTWGLQESCLALLHLGADPHISNSFNEDAFALAKKNQQHHIVSLLQAWETSVEAKKAIDAVMGAKQMDRKKGDGPC